LELPSGLRMLASLATVESARSSTSCVRRLDATKREPAVPWFSAATFSWYQCRGTMNDEVS